MSLELDQVVENQRGVQRKVRRVVPPSFFLFADFFSDVSRNIVIETKFELRSSQNSELRSSHNSELRSSHNLEAAQLTAQLLDL